MQSVPAFLTLDPVKIAKLGSALLEENFAAGENVVTQDEKGEKFYILEGGDCEVLLAVEENDPGTFKIEKLRSQCFDQPSPIIVVIIVRIIFTCSFFF